MILFFDKPPKIGYEHTTFFIISHPKYTSFHTYQQLWILILWQVFQGYHSYHKKKPHSGLHAHSIHTLQCIFVFFNHIICNSSPGLLDIDTCDLCENIQTIQQHTKLISGSK